MELAELPQWEMAVYWFLSFSSHIFSFYQLHRFSKAEHEKSLDREVHLEKGFLVWGYKKDPTDFEWSFWNEWVWRSLFCSLIGHTVVSRLCGVYLPQCRKAVLTLYGMVSAWWLLGFKGVAVLMLHLSVSLVVAQLHSPTLSWGCAILLLSTLHISSLQDVQRAWYDSEERYLLLLFSTAVCALRCISFSLELCWSPLLAGGPSVRCPFVQFRRMKELATQLSSLTSYCFYHPLFYNGPVITYKDFSQQIERPVCNVSAQWLLAKLLRVCVWWCLAEFMIHVMYMHAIQNNETYLHILSPWALDTLMWDSTNGSLGGSHHGPFQKVISTALAFGFVCFWHGFHDYLQYWALLNWLGVLVENIIAVFLTSPPLHRIIVCYLSPRMQRRGLALVSAFSTAMIILSNLVFLGGTHVGHVYWKRVFVQGWSTMAVPMLAFLYCFAQVGLEVDRKQS
ncbi:protein-cysteine N-palmitoyltransferase HHAT isoform X3 [Electrophorus electricus]|uniref:protein-cysteine N-palmitoyltransferase HHAT isoform X3 n=1 Tax=Electrophorus electricus TaxID=8005 RepID=UPI0015D06D7F|nr:protein-cysteine N-palmitoyltransferase HHAT isoform X3 [Electrophorus electricus]